MTLTRARLLLPLVLTLSPCHAQAPDPFAAHVRAGEAAARSGLPLQAVREYEAAVALHPSDAAAHYALAGVLELAGRPTEALSEYRKTVRLDPSDAAAHNALGLLLEDLGRTNEAVAQYRQAVALSPQDARLRFNLAGAEKGEGVPTRLASSPPSPPVERVKKEQRRHGGEAGVAAAPSPASSPHPHPSPFMGRGRNAVTGVGTPASLAAAGRLPEAEAAYRALLVHTPRDADAHLGLGIVLYAQGRTAPARREWTRVLTLPDPEAARRARRLLAAYP